MYNYKCLGKASAHGVVVRARSTANMIEREGWALATILQNSVSGPIMLPAKRRAPLLRSRRPVRSHWPTYEEDEIAAVVEVLQSARADALHHGERCHAFERDFATLCEMPHAIAVANGTLARELALRALDIGAGDEVIVPARGSMASTSCVVAVGATPVFADVDPDTQNLNAETVAQVMSPRTRAVIAVHLAGHPCAMDELTVLTEAYDIRIIEDCAQALGARFSGHPVGSFGDAAVFSFGADKILSTGGEGGMLLLRDEDASIRARAYRDHGKSRLSASRQAPVAAFQWLRESFGSNFRMTEMQAAIGLRQLQKLPRWLDDRRRHAAILAEELHDHSALRLTVSADDIEPAWYKFYAFVRPDCLGEGWTRDAMIEAAIASGIPCQSGACPEVYREQACIRAGFIPDVRLPNAKLLGQTSITLPVDPTLDDDAVGFMGQVVRSIADAATARAH